MTEAVAGPRQDDPSRLCGDILARLRRKPPELRYVGCSYSPDRQGKPLRATYRTPGVLAPRAERHLVKATGLPMLRRFCCQWETPRHAFRGADGREYGITMASGETTSRSRASWREIGTFEVVVETFTEDI